MQDPFIGTWKLNTTKSEFDPNHRPTAATMIFELNAEGHYVMKAEGTNAQGQPVAERPQTFITDGNEHPLPDLPGLRAVMTRPQPNTIVAAVKREDGSLVGQGRFAVSVDGQSLTATNSGFDAQLREFKQTTVWDRQ